MTLRKELRRLSRMAEPIPSPCIKVCELDPATNICRGCKRTLDEIARWGIMAPAERARVMAELPRRPRPKEP
ncbi:MAG: DUF1289 domain-containing protein [Alphaproteobacteria bacterium]